MRSSILRLAAVALCCCSLGALPAHAAAPSAKAVNLKLSDLPAGFTRSSHTSDASSDSEEFTAKSLSTLLFVESDVTVLPSKEMASATYSIAKGQVASSFKGAGLTTYKRLKIAPVGNHFIAYQGSGTVSGGLKMTMDVVVFQRATYITLLAAAGLTGSFRTAQVLAFAHVIDGRMQRAG
jgi:hypothetical protein